MVMVMKVVMVKTNVLIMNNDDHDIKKDDRFDHDAVDYDAELLMIEMNILKMGWWG